MRHRVVRVALFLIEGFVGISAFMGGVSLLRGAYAQQLSVDWLAGTPFSDYTEVIGLDSKAGNTLPSVLGLQILYFVAGLATVGLAGSLWMREYRQVYFDIRHARHAGHA